MAWFYADKHLGLALVFVTRHNETKPSSADNDLQVKTVLLIPLGSEFIFIDMTSFGSSQIYPALKMAYFDWLNMAIISNKFNI